MLNWRALFMALLAVAGMSAATLAEDAVKQKITSGTKPNILFIAIDDLNH